MSSGTGSGAGGEAGRDDGGAAAERADGIMADLSALVDAGDPDVLDAAFELQLRAAESTPDPDEAVVFALLTAAWDRHAQAPSPRAREAFISWGTRTLARLAADPGTPPGDEDVFQLRL